MFAPISKSSSHGCKAIWPTIGDYGYAFDINEVHGRKVIGHGGGFLGVSMLLAMILDTPYNIVVLSNQDPDAAVRVSGHLVSVAAAASWKSGNQYRDIGPGRASKRILGFRIGFKYKTGLQNKPRGLRKRPRKCLISNEIIKRPDQSFASVNIFSEMNF